MSALSSLTLLRLDANKICPKIKDPGLALKLSLKGYVGYCSYIEIDEELALLQMHLTDCCEAPLLMLAWSSV